MIIRSIISDFVEKHQLDYSLEEMLRKYEVYKALTLGKFGQYGGRPKKYTTDTERLQARKEAQQRYYRRKIAKNLR
jgi:hypothetical protein